MSRIRIYSREILRKRGGKKEKRNDIEIFLENFSTYNRALIVLLPRDYSDLARIKSFLFSSVGFSRMKSMNVANPEGRISVYRRSNASI